LGETAIEATTCFTVTPAVAVEPSALAVIVVEPLPVATTPPFESTVATAALLVEKETVIPSIDAPARATTFGVSEPDCPIDANVSEVGASSM
jgi:hypothetical protein